MTVAVGVWDGVRQLGVEHDGVGGCPGSRYCIHVVTTAPEREPFGGCIRQVGDGFCETLNGEGQVCDGIAVVGIDAELGHDHVRSEGFEQWRYDLAECPQVYLVPRVGV